MTGQRSTSTMTSPEDLDPQFLRLSIQWATAYKAVSYSLGQMDRSVSWDTCAIVAALLVVADKVADVQEAMR